MADQPDTTQESSMDEVLEQLQELEETVDSEAERKEVADVRDALEALPGGHFLNETIERYTTRDVAESFVGSILISLPLLVEDGVFDIADHFLSASIGGIPVWLGANVAFIVLMTWGLLYWADFRQIHNRAPFLGLIPRRLVAVLFISFFSASLTMTLWGRVDWGDPAVAFARISVIWAAAAFGAVLGDILPGESEGTEIGEIPATIGDTVGEVTDTGRSQE